MSTGNTQTKYYGLALWAMVIILAVSNGFLLRQNLQLRNLLKKFEPDPLKAGDKLESFSALGLQGENIAIRQAMLESFSTEMHLQNSARNHSESNDARLLRQSEGNSPVPS
jgi:hypothetical protein